MKRVLVTGAAGFIGRHCLPQLLATDFEVHAISSPAGTRLELPGVAWHTVDLLAPGAATELLRSVRATHLLHLAWFTEPGSFWESEQNLRWVAASNELFRGFVDTGGSRIVAVGSCAEYAWQTQSFSEAATALTPATVYGQCKNDVRQSLDELAASAGVSVAWARLFFLYGPYEAPGRLVPTVIRSLLRGQHADCTSGEQVRDFLHIHDAAAALVMLLDSDVTAAVNIGSGHGVAVRHVAECIGQKLSREHLLRFGALPDRVDDPAFLVADNRRLVNAVGWQASFSLDSGLDDAIGWWQQQTAMDDC